MLGAHPQPDQIFSAEPRQAIDVEQRTAATFEQETIVINPGQLLDALVGASSPPGGGPQPGGRERNFIEEAIAAFGRAGQGSVGGTIGRVLGSAAGGLQDMARDASAMTGGAVAQGGQAVQVATGASVEDLARRARALIGANPKLAEGALLGVAGLLFGTRKGRGIAASLVGLGGLALIGGLAYRAFQNQRTGVSAQAAEPARLAASSPESFHPARATEDDALLFLRAMVAAIAADGRMDDAERTRVTKGLAQAGIDVDATRWLEAEFARPASIDALSDPVQTPEKAALVYAAARLAIDPDTIQEREFLRQLALSLDLDPDVRRRIDDGASELRAGEPASGAPG